jgi:glyoxylate reductase
MKILITRRINDAAVELLRKALFDITYFDVNAPLDDSFLVTRLVEYDGILTCLSDKLYGDLLRNASSRLKAISNMAVGLDNIDVALAHDLGIAVFNTPGVVTDSTAEMTITMAFSLLRCIPDAQKFVLDGKWNGWDPEIFVGRSFSDLTWGIIGYGNIGQAVAKKLSGFNITKYFYDPFFKETDLYAIKTDLSFLLANSDIVSLHIPLDSSTKWFFDREKFSMLKHSSFLINMSRGGIINTEALIDALKSGRIGGAAMDVFDPEPIPYNHEILKFNNVLLTPHIGTATIECRRDMAIMAAQNLIDFFQR